MRQGENLADFWKSVISNDGIETSYFTAAIQALMASAQTLLGVGVTLRAGIPVNAVASTGTLTTAGIVNGNTVNVDGTEYTVVAALTNPAVVNEVLIEVADTDTLANLVVAITKGAGEGVKYSTGTLVHPTVTATKNGGICTFAAKVKGVSGDLITLAAVGVNLVVSGALLQGGIAGTVGVEGEQYFDVSWVYTCLAANDETGANWVRRAVGNTY